MGTEQATGSVEARAPQLDGLRALAVAAVAYSHWLPEWQFGVPFGAGVHLFFVLSGFLITRILLGVRAANDRAAAIGRFYARRALRLFPAFYVVLGLAAMADVPRVRETWAWHALYLSNLFIAGTGKWQGHVSHFWSLAVEEQFYLVWPWLIVWAPRRWLGAAIAGAVLAGPLLRVIAASAGVTEPFWALVPGGSADSLAIGAALAWMDRVAPHAGAQPGRLAIPRLASAGGGVWLLLAVAEYQAPLPLWAAAWRQVAQGVVFSWIVWRAFRGFGGIGGWVLRHPGVRFVGRISYGAYLVHAFAPRLLAGGLRVVGLDALGPANEFMRATLYATTTLVVAAVMWFVVEVPAHAWKDRVPYLSRR